MQQICQSDTAGESRARGRSTTAMAWLPVWFVCSLTWGPQNSSVFTGDVTPCYWGATTRTRRWAGRAVFDQRKHAVHDERQCRRRRRSREPYGYQPAQVRWRSAHQDLQLRWMPL